MGKFEGLGLGIGVTATEELLLFGGVTIGCLGCEVGLGFVLLRRVLLDWNSACVRLSVKTTKTKNRNIVPNVLA